MPQPHTSRDRSNPARSFPEDWASDAGWPVDAAAPEPQSPTRSPPSGERRKAPAEDARTPDDKDGNEELKRQKEGKVEKHVPNHEVPSRKAMGGGGAIGQASSTRRDMETEDTGEWVASRPFTIEDELEDTWPNLPPRYLDD